MKILKKLFNSSSLMKRNIIILYILYIENEISFNAHLISFSSLYRTYDGII